MGFLPPDGGSTGRLVVVVFLVVAGFLVVVVVVFLVVVGFLVVVVVVFLVVVGFFVVVVVVVVFPPSQRPHVFRQCFLAKVLVLQYCFH